MLSFQSFFPCCSGSFGVKYDSGGHSAFEMKAFLATTCIEVYGR